MGYSDKERTTIKKAILESVSNGATITSSIGAAGVSRTLYNKLREEDLEFSDAVIQAKMKCVRSVEDALYAATQELDKNGKHHLGAIVFYLCNRGVHKWFNTQRVEQTGKDGGPQVYSFVWGADKPPGSDQSSSEKPKAEPPA